MANLNLNIPTSASLEGFVADEAGQFRTSVAVTAEQIISAGRLLILQKFQSREALTSADAVKQYLAAKLEPKQQEVFVAVFLDNQNKVIELEELFYGTVNGASVYPREVVKRALFHNAAALIIAHNHPSGLPEPSNADKVITVKLRETLDLVDIRLLDHFVIGAGQVTSFAQLGLL